MKNWADLETERLDLNVCWMVFLGLRPFPPVSRRTQDNALYLLNPVFPLIPICYSEGGFYRAKLSSSLRLPSVHEDLDLHGKLYTPPTSQLLH